jgi:hypothetical protein
MPSSEQESRDNRRPETPGSPSGISVVRNDALARASPSRPVLAQLGVER